MRIVPYVFLLFCFLGCSDTKISSVIRTKLNGTWIPIKQEIGGTVLPKESYEKQKLVIVDSNYTFLAESMDKGTLQYKEGRMDIYGKEGVNAGKHFTAIYKYENDLLTICYNLKGNNYPDAFETKAKPLYFLSVFKKETKK